jgi:hypothetical protein
MNESIMLKDVYTISERVSGEDEAKDRWTRVGIGFVNRDDSINVVLDAVPVNGRLHIRNRRPQKPETNEVQKRR